MLYVLADTNVWLDLAKDVNGQKLIVAVRVLVHEKRLTLLVPESRIRRVRAQPKPRRS